MICPCKRGMEERRRGDMLAHAQPPGTHHLLTLEAEAVIKNVHSAEGEDDVSANTGTAVCLHTQEHTAPPTAVPGSHPWHVVIVHLPTGSLTVYHPARGTTETLPHRPRLWSSWGYMRSMLGGKYSTPKALQECITILFSPRPHFVSLDH